MAKTKEVTQAKKLEITLTKSAIACTERQKATLLALGLKKIGSKTVQNHSATLNGQLRVVGHLVSVKEVNA